MLKYTIIDTEKPDDLKEDDFEVTVSSFEEAAEHCSGGKQAVCHSCGGNVWWGYRSHHGYFVGGSCSCKAEGVNHGS